MRLGASRGSARALIRFGRYYCLTSHAGAATLDGPCMGCASFQVSEEVVSLVDRPRSRVPYRTISVECWYSLNLPSDSFDGDRWVGWRTQCGSEPIPAHREARRIGMAQRFRTCGHGLRRNKFPTINICGYILSYMIPSTYNGEIFAASRRCPTSVFTSCFGRGSAR